MSSGRIIEKNESKKMMTQTDNNLLTTMISCGAKTEDLESIGLRVRSLKKVMDNSVALKSNISENIVSQSTVKRNCHSSTIVKELTEKKSIDELKIDNDFSGGGDDDSNVIKINQKMEQMRFSLRNHKHAKYFNKDHIVSIGSLLK